MKPLYLDDFIVGQQFTSAAATLDEAWALRFAQEYDPQYFHLDSIAAHKSLFGQLIVSGWQTAAVSMRLKLMTPLGQVAGGLIGLGVDSLCWPKATYPGDTLSCIITIVEKRISQSKPTHGVLRYKIETTNQRGEIVMEALTSVWVPRA